MAYCVGGTEISEKMTHHGLTNRHNRSAVIYPRSKKQEQINDSCMLVRVNILGKPMAPERLIPWSRSMKYNAHSLVRSLHHATKLALACMCFFPTFCWRGRNFHQDRRDVPFSRLSRPFPPRSQASHRYEHTYAREEIWQQRPGSNNFAEFSPDQSFQLPAKMRGSTNLRAKARRFENQLK